MKTETQLKENATDFFKLNPTDSFINLIGKKISFKLEKKEIFTTIISIVSEYKKLTFRESTGMFSSQKKEINLFEVELKLSDVILSGQGRITTSFGSTSLSVQKSRCLIFSFMENGDVLIKSEENKGVIKYEESDSEIGGYFYGKISIISINEKSIVFY